MTSVLTRPADEDHDDPRVVPPVPVVDGAAPAVDIDAVTKQIETLLAKALKKSKN